MLSPSQRSVAMDMLRPPAGYRIDQAVLTTYSLDLDVLLALPLAVLAHSDCGVDELLADPLLPGKVDSKDVKKHRADVVRLYQYLSPMLESTCRSR
jgi:hypothetical protein